MPNENFRVKQLASIALAPNNALQQFMEDHESDVYMKEREEIDDIFFHQPPLIKHNLPVKDLGTTLPPKEDPIFKLIRKYIMLLSVVSFQERKKKGYWRY
jgi:hypothetical protein